MRFVTYRDGGHLRHGFLVDGASGPQIVDLANALLAHEREQRAQPSVGDVAAKYGGDLVGFIERQDVAMPVARALEARAKGDVVGAANDLNRALAYDPGDPKLMRTVTTLRTRERWARTARVGVPAALLAVGVGLGGVSLARLGRRSERRCGIGGIRRVRPGARRS